jgi:transposase-like protein
MDEKKAVIFQCWNHEEPFTESCLKFGINTKTRYKWLSQFKDQGVADIADLSCAPNNNAHKAGEIVKKRMHLKKKHPYRRVYKLLTLYNTYPYTIAPEELFNREGYA